MAGMNDIPALLLTVLSGLTILVHLAHVLGFQKVAAAQLQSLAKGGGALAPVEDALAQHLLNGDDEAALALARAALGHVSPSTSASPGVK